MALVACLGDTSTHGGNIITAGSKTNAQGRPIARVGDSFSCPVHGISPIVTGASKYRTEGKVTALIGSVTGCGATISSGASKVASPLGVGGAVDYGNNRLNSMIIGIGQLG